MSTAGERAETLRHWTEKGRQIDAWVRMMHAKYGLMYTAQALGLRYETVLAVAADGNKMRREGVKT
jgi:hypothetical protein